MCGIIEGIVGGLGIISAGVSAMSAGMGAMANQQAHTYNAQLAERNAEISEMQSQQEIEKGQTEERQHRQNLARLKGSQRSSFGASGVLADQDSALDVLDDTSKFGELDALTIRHNAAKSAWGYDTQAQNYRNQGALERSAASYENPMLAAGTSLLSGGSSLAGQFMQLSK